MRFWGRKRRERSARVCESSLALVRVNGLHAAADVLAPADFNKVVSGIVRACETAASTANGSVCDLDISGFKGAFATLAWDEPDRPELPSMSTDLLTSIRQALVDVPAAVETRVVVSLCRGRVLRAPEAPDAAALRPGVFGAPVNRALRLLDRAPERGDAIVLDRSVRSDFPAGAVRDLDDASYLGTHHRLLPDTP